MKTIASYCLILGMASIIVPCSVATAQAPPNTLTSSEAAHGWKLMFDGKDLDEIGRAHV